MARVYIGLGSNLGDRRANLEAALSALGSRGIGIIAASGIAETDPVDFLRQPKFLNRVVLVDTRLDPLALLSALKDIERALGRTPGHPKGPRIIDLDILVYEGIVMDSEMLTLPHPSIGRRDFVLAHLVELDPCLTCPRTGRLYADILATLREPACG